MTSQRDPDDVTRGDEFSLIADYFAPLAQDIPGAFHLQDDAAILTPTDGYDLVITKDMLVADVHFFAEDSPDLIARKALRVNLSDLAAKGAQPIAYSLACAWPQSTTMGWIERFVAGLAMDQKHYDVSLIGGDTVRTPGPLTISITAYGEVPYGKMISRAGAEVGDLICVSGTIGDAGLGLRLLQQRLTCDEARAFDFLTDRYHIPQPRVALGHALLAGATACLDVSDGMVADATHLARSSKVGLDINIADIPISEAAQRCGVDPVDLISSGDDYELLFTCPANKRDAVKRLAKQLDVSLSVIGKVVEGSGVHVRDAKGNTISIDKGGYTHF